MRTVCAAVRVKVRKSLRRGQDETLAVSGRLVKVAARVEDLCALIVVYAPLGSDADNLTFY